MSANKPRTETPKNAGPKKPIPPAPQEFVLSKEELAQAAANFVRNTRNNCRFRDFLDYEIIHDHIEYRITLRPKK